MLIHRIGRREISDGTNCLSKGRTMGKHGASLEKGVILFSLISSVQVEIWLKKLGLYLFFWPYFKAYRIYFPDQELDPGPLRREFEVPATGPPHWFSSFLFPAPGAHLPLPPGWFIWDSQLTRGSPEAHKQVFTLPRQPQGPLICAAASPAISCPLALHPREHQLLQVVRPHHGAPARLRSCAHQPLGPGCPSPLHPAHSSPSVLHTGLIASLSLLLVLRHAANTFVILFPTLYGRCLFTEFCLALSQGTNPSLHPWYLA